MFRPLSRVMASVATLLLLLLLSTTPANSFSFHHARPFAAPRGMERVVLSADRLESAVSTAAVAAAAVSKAVSMKTLEAPDLDSSFIAIDSNSSAVGAVDADGLPLVYNKELIEVRGGRGTV